MTETNGDGYTVPPAEIIAAVQVRELCGIKTRNTLIHWRKTRGFPEPIATVPGASGPSPLELWDRRHVQAWLKEQKRLEWHAKRARGRKRRAARVGN